MHNDRDGIEGENSGIQGEYEAIVRTVRERDV